MDGQLHLGQRLVTRCVRSLTRSARPPSAVDEKWMKPVAVIAPPATATIFRAALPGWARTPARSWA